MSSLPRCRGSGSSPRVWGTPVHSHKLRSLSGLIPTGVGNTSRTCSASRKERAHPHGCGEHTDYRRRIVYAGGSSPRVWGTPNPCQSSGERTGLIPTGVGNTTVIGRRSALRAAHPHGCGEHVTSDDDAGRPGGSSPRVWGTLHVGRVAMTICRLIPTGVGNTCVSARVDAMRRAHPHGCGEHHARRCRHVRRNGSSPRVWGTLRIVPEVRKVIRLIPTGVGNTT